MNNCRVHGNTELGDCCAELVEKLDPSRLNEKSKVGLLLEETPDSIKNKEQNKLASQNLQFRVEYMNIEQAILSIKEMTRFMLCLEV